MFFGVVITVGGTHRRAGTLVQCRVETWGRIEWDRGRCQAETAEAENIARKSRIQRKSCLPTRKANRKNATVSRTY